MRTQKTRITLARFVTDAHEQIKIPPGNEVALMSYYQAVLSSIEHEDGRRWVLFSAFLVAIGALVPGACYAPEGLPRNTVFSIGIAVSLVGWLVIWRNNVYLKDRTYVAAALQKVLLDYAAPVWLYDSDAHIPSERLALQSGRSGARLVHFYTAWALMRTVLWSSAVLWTAGLVWQIPDLRQDVPVVAVCGLAFTGVFLLAETIARIVRYWPWRKAQSESRTSTDASVERVSSETADPARVAKGPER